MTEEHPLRYPVPVVRLIVPDEECRVLLLRRKNTRHSPGAWCLPGGKVDWGRTVKETIHSELREETSLACTSLRFLFFQDSLPGVGADMHCLNLYYECRTEGEVTLNEESSEFRWVDRHQLRGLRVAFLNDRAITRYWDEM